MTGPVVGVDDVKGTGVPVSASLLLWLKQPASDGRTTRHPGYAVSQRARKRIEEAFG